MTSSYGDIFHVTGHLCGEFNGHRWIPHTKTSDVELWYFSLICAWNNSWTNNGHPNYLRRHHAHCDVTVMTTLTTQRLGSALRIIGPLWWDPPVTGGFLVKSISPAEFWCLLSCQPQNTVDKIVKLSVIWDMTLMWHDWNDDCNMQSLRFLNNFSITIKFKIW